MVPRGAGPLHPHAGAAHTPHRGQPAGTPLEQFLARVAPLCPIPGEVPLSVIFVDAPPGSGPTLHRHPYPEVFIVQEGTATYTVGEATFTVRGGQVAIAPTGMPHKFTNSGDGPLRQIDIHCNDRFVTEWLEE